MKKFKYAFLISVTTISFICAIISCYGAFSLDKNVEIRLVQYFAAIGALNEASLKYIQQILPNYTTVFAIIFALMLVAFLFSIIVLILSLKKERPVQEWLNAHRATKEQKAKERKAERISELEKELNELKKGGE